MLQDSKDDEPIPVPVDDEPPPIPVNMRPAIFRTGDMLYRTTGMMLTVNRVLHCRTTPGVGPVIFRPELHSNNTYLRRTNKRLQYRIN